MADCQCCRAILALPAQSSAQNIIVDFRLNLVRPNTDVLYQQGPSFHVLQDNISQIQNKLIQTVYNVNPNAPSVYKYSRIALIVGFFVTFILTIVMQLFVDGSFFFIAVAMTFVIMGGVFGYFFWVKKYILEWSEKVVPKILDYVKNEFKSTYSQTIDIHVLYPIQEFRRGRHGRQMVANWVVVRITNGPIQQPINAPVYWSSNGTVVQELPVVVQQTQQQMTYVQQPMVMQPQQQQMMYQTQPQQMMQQPQMMYQPQQVQNQVYSQQQQQSYNVNNYS